MRKTHYLHYSPEAGSNYYERSEKTEFIEAIMADTLSFSLLEVTFHMLIGIANSLDPDQDRQNVCPDLDPKCLTLW